MEALFDLSSKLRDAGRSRKESKPFFGVEGVLDI